MKTVLALALLAGAGITQAQAPPPPASPCLRASEWHQFDFWLGEWDVLEAGKPIARSTIDKGTAGCIVNEHYVETEGYSGRSINFFDPALRRWRQTWVDALGNVSEFSGELRDGAMRFAGESHVANGRRVLRRLTFFPLPGGRVRQLSERSTDGGKTWAVHYDYEYVRHRHGAR